MNKMYCSVGDKIKRINQCSKSTYKTEGSDAFDCLIRQRAIQDEILKDWEKKRLIVLEISLRGTIVSYVYIRANDYNEYKIRAYSKSS